MSGGKYTTDDVIIIKKKYRIVFDTYNRKRHQLIQEMKSLHKKRSDSEWWLSPWKKLTYTTENGVILLKDKGTYENIWKRSDQAFEFK